jgi:hypothetical protein
MSTETETKFGECPTHGPVEGAREIPRIAFPPLISAIRRSVAKRRRPYRCPQCGAEVASARPDAEALA